VCNRGLTKKLHDHRFDIEINEEFYWTENGYEVFDSPGQGFIELATKVINTNTNGQKTTACYISYNSVTKGSAMMLLRAWEFVTERL
jgi:hypothetical protein